MSAAPPAPAGKRADGAALALLVALAAAYLAPALVGGRALMPVEMLRVAEPWKSETPGVAALRPPNRELSDALWEVLPMAEASARAWSSGVPLWNPHLMLGAPALATGKLYSHPVFVPLAFLLEPIEALDWTAFLQLALAGCGMFLLLRELGCRTLAALAGALVFELNTPLLRWLSLPFMTGSIAWTPWVFLGLERAVARRRPAWAALAAAAFALQLLSGYILVSYLCALAAAARFAGPLYRAARARCGREATAIFLAGAIGLGGGVSLAAFQVLPSLELFGESIRGQPIEPLAYFSPRAAFTLLAPRAAGLPDEAGGMDRGRYGADELPLYVGIVPLALILAAAVIGTGPGGANTPRAGRSYPLLALLPALAAWGIPVFAWIARLAVPMLASSAYSRLWSWIVFAAAVAAGLGLERLVAALEAGGKAARRAATAAIAAFVLILVAALLAWRVASADGGDWLRHPGEFARAAAWSAGAVAIVVAALARRLAPRTLLVIFALAPAVDLMTAIRGWNRFSDPRLVLPETPTLAALAAAVAEDPAGEAPRILNLHSNWTLPGRTPERFGFETVSGYTSWMLRRVSLYGWATGERAAASINHFYFESCCRPLLDALAPRFLLVGSGMQEEIDPSRSLVQRIRRTSRGERGRAGLTTYAMADGRRERWLIEHPPGRIEVTLPRGAGVRFRGAIGIRPEAIGCPTDGVSFAIAALGPEGEREIYRDFLDPVRVPGDRAPRRFDLDLTALAAGATALVLETGAGPAGDTRCDWAGWVDARFELAKPDPLRRIRDGPNQIFENLDALPRAWIVHEAEVRPPGDLEAVRAAIADPEFAPRRLAVLEGGAPPPLAPATGPEAARVTGRSAERLAIAVSVTAPGVLILSDAWYPGWRATVDGVERPIFPANLALRAVAVAPGDREVVFTYRPRSFAAGAWISAAAFSLGAIWLLAALARRRPEGDKAAAIASPS